MVKVKFTTTINVEVLKEMKKMAIDKGVNVNDIIEDLFRKEQKQLELRGEELERERTQL